jgi:hypothetical protein
MVHSCFGVIMARRVIEQKEMGNHSGRGLDDGV